jgi:hypothetical protein
MLVKKTKETDPNSIKKRETNVLLQQRPFLVLLTSYFDQG